MFRAFLVAASCAALLGAASADEPGWYSCDCSEAGDPSNCMCPSLEPPGGIPRHKAPQFILFTHDDAIEWDTDGYMRKVCDGHYNPNGCPVRATMFTMVKNTDCDYAYSMWRDGYEIASHTVSHPAMPDGFSRDDAEYQIDGVRSWMAEECGIPEDEIKGFRNPYLQTSPESRQVLHEKGFLYDSTLIEGNSESLSYPMEERVWPYTLDFGIAQNCGWYSPSQTCSSRERYPGLWEVPVWEMTALGRDYTMDYGDDGMYPLWEILKANFDETYSGNRAPFPIFIHTPWFNDERIADLQKFVEYTLELGDVYWVTMTQLIEWMNNPVPADQLKHTGAMCGNAPPPPSPPPPPPPPRPMPVAGLNVSLTFSGPVQADLGPEAQATLAAAVQQLLGSAAAATFVRAITPVSTAATSGTPAPVPAAVPAPAANSTTGGASAAPGSRRRLAQARAQPQRDAGFLQFEAPSFPGFRPKLPASQSRGGKGLGSVGALSLEAGSEGQQEGGRTAAAAAAASTTTLQVTLVAAASDPLAAYNQAISALSTDSLAPVLSQLNLSLQAAPEVVPFRNGVALSLPPPPPLPSPSPAPAPPSPQPAPPSGPSPDAGGSNGNNASPPSSGGGSGLPQWEIVLFEILGGLVALAAIALAAVLVVRRRRRRAAAEAAAAAGAASAFSSFDPGMLSSSDADSKGLEDEGKEARQEGQQHCAINLGATTG